MRLSLLHRLVCGTSIACLTTLLMLGCSSEPTASSNETGPQAGIPLTSTIDPPPTLSGPAYVTTNGNYSYDGKWSRPYVSMYWATRFCDVSTVAGCSVAWSTVQATTIFENGWERYTRALTRDCTLAGKKSFQVRVNFTAFGQQPVTLYAVTNRCSPVEP